MLNYKVDYENGHVSNYMFCEIESVKKDIDENCCYTQNDIKIIDIATHKIVSKRIWCGCLDGIKIFDNPIQFGNYGYYSDWMNDVSIGGDIDFN
ncbi:MAG: hypothetical protein RSC93_07320 [Erysipelotrichaceae bacterium]